MNAASGQRARGMSLFLGRPPRHALALCVALFVSLGAESARASPDTPGSESERVSLPEQQLMVAENVPDGRALAGGALLFTVGYVPAVATGARHDFAEGSGWLLVPVAGPFAALAADAPIQPWAFALDGVVQVMGAGIIVGALVFPKRSFRRLAIAPLSLTQPGFRATYAF